MASIREAKEDDEATVVQLWQLCGLAVSYNDPVQDFHQALRGPSSTILVADEGATGAIMVGHDGHRGWLYYVAAHPDERGKGLGRQLVEAAQAWLRERGVAKCQLLIRENNVGVAAFYESLGYEVTPRTVMAKWL
ncbi:N-acetyltransferase GCN5 [Jaminaea rosea]|uniref:N-acetyltransferase GCN5 n=1 Tax=Jaminaea rosea TaxID=1569628 RepID=A0A316UNF8_9BASI|nr:N-acetyltransferase GCN5 [Jaminaea rosea]PWN24695.1 N-acetyltransferase GCN5 [Jaminaea rosea]